MPWRATPAREPAWRHVRAWYTTQLPDAAIIEADSGHAGFHRAASRNAGVAEAARLGAGVVVVADADTLPSPDGLRAAIAGCGDGRLRFGYGTLRYLDAAGTADVLAGREPADGSSQRHNSSVLVLTPTAWAVAGGQDERFDGWGGEDDAFHAACDTLLGASIWCGGQALSLHHDDASRDVGSPRWAPNSALATRYVGARGKPGAMRALIAERDLIETRGGP